MAREFKLPDLGEGIHEGEIVSVLVSVGDSVTEGDPIMEVETDKATVELPSPYTGRVAQILVKPGDLVKVGDVLLAFEVASAAPAAGRDRPAEADRPRSEPQKAPHPEPGSISGKKRPVPASPSTRRLARELGVDLYAVTPSGPSGLVTAEDVRAFAAKGPAKPEPVEAQTPEAVPLETFGGGAVPELPDFSRWGPVETVALRSIRRATARQMTLAWSQIPHVSMQDDIDVSRLEAMRRRLKAGVEKTGGRLTLTVFAVKAVAAALKTYPQFCVSLDPGKGVIIRKNYIHVGVAADTGRGLVVPVIRDADRKSITEIAVELEDLLLRTRERKVSPEALAGGVFTVTNIGAAGGRGHFSPMINYPEAAILGMSRARMQPVVLRRGDGRFGTAARLIMPVVLAIDHRVLDGIDAARFLEHLRGLLENPERLLISI